MAGRMAFLLRFLRSPSVIGAVAPSSRGLAHQIVGGIDFSEVQSVVEYGPGTGVFSKEILARLNGSTTYFALEIDKAMVGRMAHAVPGVKVYHDSVVNVRKYLDAHSCPHADVIISGLPWAAFSNALQDELLDATLEALRDGGIFATFAYLHGLLLPAGRAFRRKLSRRFSAVTRSKITWLNLPPAFVNSCRK